jgi:hypothetical protein
MSKLEQLLAQRAAMDEAIAAETSKGREDALVTVRTLCKQFGISLREVKPYVLDRKPRVGKNGVAVAKKKVVRKTTTGAKRGRPAKS